MSPDQKPNVGLRIRKLRERDRLSLRALSERCGLSINAISQIERGENSPTVASLHRLASALNVPITDFFQDEDKQVTVFVEKEAGLRTQSNGVLMESLGIGLPNQQIEPFRMIVMPGKGNGREPISHPGEELVHCLEGKLEYQVGDLTYILHPGDSLLFEASQPHGYHNKGDEPAVALLVFQNAQIRSRVRQLHLHPVQTNEVHNEED